jgi:hypothetical protein
MKICLLHTSIFAAAQLASGVVRVSFNVNAASDKLATVVIPA